MKISVSGPLPPTADLVTALNKKFGPLYRFTTYGLGKHKTILARKSALVGLQISVRDGEVHFQPSVPSTAGPAVSFMMFTELATLLILPVLIISRGFTKDPYRKMAKEIGFFLRDAY